MAREEILSKLGAKTQRYEVGGGASGDVLTDSDVAASLSLVTDRIGQGLLALRVADQWGYYHELENEVAAAVRDRARRGAWRTRGRDLPGLIRSMSRLAIFEHCIPQKCRACKGRGNKYPKGEEVARTCSVCNGAGERPMKEADRYRELGLDKRAWDRRWGIRYRWIQRMLGERDQDARRELAKALRR